MCSHQNYHICSSRGHDEVLYIFKRLEIQDGCPGLWFAKTFWTSSRELLHVKTADLREMFLQVSARSVVVFSEWFEIQHGHPNLWLSETFFSQNWFIWSHQSYNRWFSWILKKWTLYFFEWLRNPSWLPEALIGPNIWFLSEKVHAKSSDFPELTVLMASMSFSYVENLISSVLSHRINYRLIDIHIIIWWGFPKISTEQRKITLIFL